MKKETKYTLLSLPIIFLLSTFIYFLFLDANLCDYGWFSLQKYCTGIGMIDFFINFFGGGVLISILSFPAYIFIPLITFFITRHFRKKQENQSFLQPVVAQSKQKSVAVWIIVITISLILFYIWSKSFLTQNLISDVELGIQELFKAIFGE